MKAKQKLYKTCVYNGEYVKILRDFFNGEKFGTWRYSIQLADGSIEAQVDESELTDFCL